MGEVRASATASPMAVAITATSASASRPNSARGRSLVGSAAISRRRWYQPAAPRATSAITLPISRAPYAVCSCDQPSRRTAAETTPEAATATNETSANVE